MRSGIADKLARAAEILRSHAAEHQGVLRSENAWKRKRRCTGATMPKPPRSTRNGPKSALRRYCNKRWAPPDVKAPPGHCTGAAVDVKLFTLGTSEEMDHVSPYTEWWDAASTRVGGLAESAAATRRLLCYAMHSAGFSNCRDEYWHWSYGDSAWAVRVGASEASYGLIAPPDGAYPVPEEPKPDAEAEGTEDGAESQREKTE